MNDPHPNPLPEGEGWKEPKPSPRGRGLTGLTREARVAALAVSFIAAAALGQPRPEPVPESVVLVRDVVYSEVPGPGEGSIELTLDAAFPRQSGDALLLPAVIYIHGGSYRSGSKEMGLPFVIAFAEGGYFAASINYRLSGVAPFPAAVHDCREAVRFLRAGAKELGIDPDRIGVWGPSAGGHLSALVATSGNDRTLEAERDVAAAVRCAVAVSAPVDFRRFDAARGRAAGMFRQWLGEDPDVYRRNAEAASPLAYLDKSDPPILIVHGTADRLVPIEQAEIFKAALEEAGVPVELVAIEGGDHYLAQRAPHHRIAEFFDEHLGGNAASVKRFMAELKAEN